MQFLRRTMKLFLPALLAILALGACNKDKFGDGALDADKSASRKNNYVVYFDIRTNDDAVTRGSYSDVEDAGSGDLVYGSEDEHAIGRGNFAFFFKEDNQLIAISNIYLDSHRHNTDGDEQVKDENGNLKDNIEARYAAKMELDSENLPNSCLLLLNALHLEDKLKDITDKMSDENNPATFTLTDILALVDEVGKNENPFSIGRDGEDNKYFTMSNAVYVKDKKLQTAVPIPDGFIQQTPVPDPKKALTVYVERMVAKFTFELPVISGEKTRVFHPDGGPLMLFDQINNIGTTNYKAVKWQIELRGWGINALETSNYVFKKIDATGDSSYPGGTSFWQDTQNYRTYWSIDPHYAVMDASTGQPSYPWQYRDMLDRTYSGENKISDYVNFHYYAEKHESDQDQNVLRNFSYDDFERISNNDFSRVIYVPENTYDYSSDENGFTKALDDRPHKLAGTHLIVCAELQTDFSEIPGWDGGFKPNDLYRDRYGIYYKSQTDCFKSLVHAFNRLLSSQSSMNFTYYNWDGTGDNSLNGKIFTIRPTLENKEDTYALTYDGEIVTKDSDFLAYDLAIATIRNGDGRRLPWPVKHVNGERKDITLGIKSPLGRTLSTIYEQRKAEGDPWVPTKDISFDQNVVKSLLFEWFGPIDHFNSGKMYYSKPVENPSGTTNFYGVVRNSWYCYKLSDVANLGTSVDDPTQPIVPLVIETNDQINVRIKILDWHTEDTNVTLPN